MPYSNEPRLAIAHRFAHLPEEVSIGSLQALELCGFPDGLLQGLVLLPQPWQQKVSFPLIGWFRGKGGGLPIILYKNQGFEIPKPPIRTTKQGLPVSLFEGI